MDQLLSDGRTLKGTQIVAADVIAAMAGVPRNTVNKVLIALTALNIVCPELDLQTIANVDNLPGEAADQVRIDNTNDFLRDGLHRLKQQPYKQVVYALRLHRFWSAPPYQEPARSMHVALGNQQSTCS